MKRSGRITAGKPGPDATELGFSLIELLVVVAIIGILAGLLLPALVRAKSRGESISCLGNQRQLIVSCLLYTGDNDGRLPYNFGVEGTRRTVAEETYLNWVNNVMTWELEPENIDAGLIAAGGLGPYVDGALRVFRCPADDVLSDLQKNAGWTARTRSVSMNAMVGDAGEFTVNGSNVNNPYYEQFFKLAQITEPSRIFVFVEEHPDSINDGYFLNKVPNQAYSPEWHDLPASYHMGSANFAFADGHAQNHRWRFPSTKPPSRPDAAKLPFAIPAREREDFDWLMERTSRRRHMPSSY